MYGDECFKGERAKAYLPQGQWRIPNIPTWQEILKKLPPIVPVWGRNPEIGYRPSKAYQKYKEDLQKTRSTEIDFLNLQEQEENVDVKKNNEEGNKKSGIRQFFLRI